MNPNEFWTNVDRMIDQLRSEGFGVKFADDQFDIVNDQRLFNTVQNARPSLRPMYNNP